VCLLLCLDFEITSKRESSMDWSDRTAVLSRTLQREASSFESSGSLASLMAQVSFVITS